MFPECLKQGSRYVEVDSVVILYFIYFFNLVFYLIQLSYLGFVISVHLIVNLISSCNMVHMPFWYISSQTPYRGQSEIPTFRSSLFCTQLWELPLWLFSFPRWLTCRERPIIHGDTSSLCPLPPKWLDRLGYMKCSRMMFLALISWCGEYWQCKVWLTCFAYNQIWFEKSRMILTNQWAKVTASVYSSLLAHG